MQKLEISDEVIGHGTGGVIFAAKLWESEDPDAPGQACAVKCPRFHDQHATELAIWGKIDTLRGAIRRLFPEILGFIDVATDALYSDADRNNVKLPETITLVAIERIQGYTMYDWPNTTMAEVHFNPLTNYREKAIKIAVKLTAALEALHGLGVVVRDIHPSNILYDTQSGEPKWIDFDRSKIPNAEGDEGVPEILHARSHFLAPESFFQESTDKASDIFSYGIMLYHLLTGYNLIELGPQSSIFMYQIAWRDRYARQTTKITAALQDAVIDELAKIYPDGTFEAPKYSPQMYNLWRADEREEKRRIMRLLTEETIERLAPEALEAGLKEKIISEAIRAAYEHLTNNQLTGKANLEEIIDNNLANNIDNIELRVLIKKMCSMNPVQRPSAREVKETLEGLLD